MGIFLLAAQASDGLGVGTILVMIFLVAMGAASGEKRKGSGPAHSGPNRPDFGLERTKRKRRMPRRGANHLRDFEGE